MLDWIIFTMMHYFQHFILYIVLYLDFSASNILVILMSGCYDFVQKWFPTIYLECSGDPFKLELLFLPSYNISTCKFNNLWLFKLCGDFVKLWLEIFRIYVISKWIKSVRTTKFNLIFKDMFLFNCGKGLESLYPLQKKAKKVLF